MALEVYVFAYDFPHRKSEDIILSCIARGLNLAGVLAAPRKKLANHANAKAYISLPMQAPTSPSELCRHFGIPYHVVEHEDDESIRGILSPDAIGIIGGARIIPASVIHLFANGIVNYHPGPIPETSGLDSFYWMIKKTAPPVITAHFVDERVDAGRLIESRKVEVNVEDTPATVNYKLYMAQLESHLWLVENLRDGKLPASKLLERPARNSPMSDNERHRVLLQFPEWLQQHAT